MNKPLCILQVGTSDKRGGAEKVAYDVHRIYRKQGFFAWLAVGHKRTDDPDVVLITDHATNLWQQLWFSAGNFFARLESRMPFAGRLRRWLRLIGQPKVLLEIYQGHENFEFTGSWQIIDSLPQKPDIIHCHNLHGGYFDIKVLPWLSQKAPIILTLHDAWLLSGHCAHSFDCDRWKTGCGLCPDLSIYPGIRKDATALNWQHKKEIYDSSRLYVVTPCNWLMQKVEQSILAPAILGARVIPNGVDLSVFHPADLRNAREALSIPQDAFVLLFVARGIRQNIWKDSQTMRTAVAMIGERFLDQKVLFLAIGENAPPEQIGKAKIIFVPYQKDTTVVAAYYQAADIYLHAAKADTFPNTILEALACGTPVVATSVGGIPEQVKSLYNFTIKDWRNRPGWPLENNILSTMPSYKLEEATGILVPPGDAAAMAGAIEILMTDKTLRKRIGVNAAKDACKRFDLERCAYDYLTWYQEIIGKSV